MLKPDARQVHFLGDPRMNELTAEQWELFDEGFQTFPQTAEDSGGRSSKTLYQRYKYVETDGRSELTRVTTTTIKSRYCGGLYKFINWAIQEKPERRPPPHLRVHRSRKSGAAAARLMITS